MKLKAANRLATLITATTVAQVNKALKKEGIKDELIKGDGYFYFSGPLASDWADSSIPVYSIGNKSTDDLVNEYHRLKLENDPDEQDRRNEERYGKKTAPVEKLRRK